MSPFFRHLPLPAAALAILVAVAGPVSTATSQEAAAGGYERTYTIQADACWLPGGRVLSPAFVSLDKGVIARISTTAPPARSTVFGTQKPNIIKVKGTLAPSLVDAWSGLPMAGRDGGRRPLPQSRIAEDLPVMVPGADAALAARVDALRNSGVGFVYLGRTDGNLQRGLGVVTGFSVNDLPYAIGDDWLDFAGTGSGSAAQIRAQDLKTAFDNAVALRDSRDDYEEKLDKYEEDLKKYEESFAKYLEEQKKDGKKGGNARAEDPKSSGKKKDDKRPKRPKRPASPRRNVAGDLILDAIDGKLRVRIQADSEWVVAVAVELVEEHNLDLVLVNAIGGEAYADSLADHGIGVVLDLSRQLAGDDALAEEFLAYRKAGVDVALGSGGRDLGPMLLTLAGELVAAGVDQDEVWRALTSTPANLLGLSGQAGALQRGASGSMILFGGAHPFDASGVFRSHQPK
ncbi:MAG: hypothetical protein MK209_04260 [Planctomycetes bacterium]|nr:hypothetical protein [Planctomycetota bacterium]